jgi:hypothetical protein
MGVSVIVGLVLGVNVTVGVGDRVGVGVTLAVIVLVGVELDVGVKLDVGLGVGLVKKARTGVLDHNQAAATLSAQTRFTTQTSVINLLQRW